jgi:hypothetical protein
VVTQKALLGGLLGGCSAALYAPVLWVPASATINWQQTGANGSSWAVLLFPFPAFIFVVALISGAALGLLVGTFALMGGARPGTRGRLMAPAVGALLGACVGLAVGSIAGFLATLIPYGALVGALSGLTGRWYFEKTHAAP